MWGKNVIFFLQCGNLCHLFVYFNSWHHWMEPLLRKLIAAPSCIVWAPKGSLWCSQAPATDPSCDESHLHPCICVCKFALYRSYFPVRHLNEPFPPVHAMFCTYLIFIDLVTMIDWLIDWLIYIYWVQALTVPMHLDHIDGPFVPHNLISAQKSPVHLPKFQMAPRLKILMSSGPKKGTQIYYPFLSKVSASESQPGLPVGLLW